VLEALSCGLRVVASPVGCLPERLSEPLGVCVRDHEELVDELLRLALSPPSSDDRRAVRAGFMQAHLVSPLLDALAIDDGRA